MSKYNYDKSLLKGLVFGDFLNQVKVREQHIAQGDESIPTSIYNPNVLANKLHPGIQFVKVKEVIDRKDAKTFVFEPDEKKGTKQLAYFKAGQYISIVIEFDGAFMCRPYSLCSSPKNALGEINNTYAITVKSQKDGYASKYILENWKVGTEVIISAPVGQFTYERLRDQKDVIAVAGGSGITPFVSMASAIADGIQDFNLTILYGNRTYDSILLKDELDNIVARSNGKVKIVYVLSDEQKDGYEHGLINEALIRKYAPENYSIFICGPKAMFKFIANEIVKLGLPRRKVRYEVSGEYGDPTHDEKYPKDKADKTYNVKVWIHGESMDITCKSEESLLHAMETAGIRVLSDCRSGICGWCHSRLISGDTYIPESNDGRRAADKKFGWVHPCVTFPLSDIEIEVFPK